MDQEQILSQDSETAGSQQDETQKEKTYFADYTLKANELKKAIYLDNSCLLYTSDAADE